tara:strand:+ start:15093 stop:16148 length:1056 start_codon:yes stop_codon:yes gene_type:complete
MLEAVGFINVTRQCNVDCKRCYLTESNRKAKERLPLSILSEFLKHRFWENRDVTLIWEGGEPSLVGKGAMELYCRTARNVLPQARQTMVTNCFSVPDWLIAMVHDEFAGNVETTFAFGKKYSLSGSEELYQSQFLKGLNRFWDSGIECPVNVELNAETISAGVNNLAKIILESKCRSWEFDVSVDFRSFLQAPEYAASTVPLLPLTASYADAWAFIRDLQMNWGQRFNDAGVSIGAFEQEAGQGNNQFNVACENRFLTLNPDGVVTTNPLYSDLEGTFLGNVEFDGLDEILANRNRLMRILAERKRTQDCHHCVHLPYCGGGPSHVPVLDGSGECAGGKGMWDKILGKQNA